MADRCMVIDVKRPVNITIAEVAIGWCCAYIGLESNRSRRN